VRLALTLTVLKFVGSAAIAAVGFAVLYLVFVRTHGGQLVDQLAFNGADVGERSVAPVANALLDAVPAVAGFVGLVLTVVITIARRNWGTALVAIGAAGAAALTTQLLKLVFLDRPDLQVDGYADNSFPSGHTTVAAASALAVFLVSSPSTRARVAGWGTLFTILAGLSTLANGWHRPSDAIAALLVVAFWGCLAGAVITLMRPSAVTAAAPGPRTTGRWWIVVPFLVVTTIAFLITYLGARSDQSVVGLIAYIGGAAAIVTAGCALALLATRTFARLP
jgi:membrane-associated phospholipid phosphatase